MTETEEPPIMPPEIAHAQADAFLKVSSPESREIVLLALLKELIELNTDVGYIFLETAEGEDWGVYLPPKAAEAMFTRPGGPILTPEREAELDERLTRLHESIPIDQAIEELRQEEIRLRAEMLQPRGARLSEPAAGVFRDAPSEQHTQTSIL